MPIFKVEVKLVGVLVEAENGSEASGYVIDNIRNNGDLISRLHFTAKEVEIDKGGVK
jgi:hypothetical protein